MPWQRWTLLFIFGLSVLVSPLVLPQSSSSAQNTPPPVELHEGLVGQISKLNPLYAPANPVDRDISSLIYEGLTTINQYGEVVPDLAAGWVVSDDGLDYIFQLRQDVLWQDGLPFTAADVAYTFRTIRSADFTGDPALRDFWRTVEIRVISDSVIRFRLVQPLASFPERLRQGILPLHALEGAPVATLDTHPFNLSPIGTGPYQIEALFATGGQISGISLRVAPNYRLRPEGQSGYLLDRVVFRTYPSLEAALAAFQAGEINSLGYVPNEHIDTLRATPGLSLHTTLAPALGALIYNWRKDDLHYFRNPEFRLALAYATDRPGAVLRGLGGRALPSDSPILPSSWAFNPAARYPSQNVAEALRLMGLVSFDPYQAPTPPATEENPEPAAPAPVEQRRNFKIMVLDDPAIAGVAFEVMNQWIPLGFNIELDLVDFETLLSRLQSGDFDVALVEYSFEPKADPDPFIFWHQGQYQVGQNYGGIQDPFISSLLLRARTSPNNLYRKQYYQQFQATFAATAPAMILYNPLFVYATDSRLGGVQLDFISNPSDRFRSIQDWSFSE